MRERNKGEMRGKCAGHKIRGERGRAWQLHRLRQERDCGRLHRKAILVPRHPARNDLYYKAMLILPSSARQPLRLVAKDAGL